MSGDDLGSVMCKTMLCRRQDFFTITGDRKHNVSIRLVQKHPSVQQPVVKVGLALLKELRPLRRMCSDPPKEKEKQGGRRRGSRVDRKLVWRSRDPCRSGVLPSQSHCDSRGHGWLVGETGRGAACRSGRGRSIHHRRRPTGWPPRSYSG